MYKMNQVVKKPSNAVKFGKYAICLEKEQLSYYYNGNLTKVVDVTYEFTNKDLYNLATRISTKNNFGPVEYITNLEARTSC
jgi:hypothetical protein